MVDDTTKCGESSLGNRCRSFCFSSFSEIDCVLDISFIKSMAFLRLATAVSCSFCLLFCKSAISFFSGIVRFRFPFSLSSRSCSFCPFSALLLSGVLLFWVARSFFIASFFSCNNLSSISLFSVSKLCKSAMSFSYFRIMSILSRS